MSHSTVPYVFWRTCLETLNVLVCAPRFTAEKAASNLEADISQAALFPFLRLGIIKQDDIQ